MKAFENKVAVITGGANGIGRCIADEFRKNGAIVCVIDTVEGDHFTGDIGDKATLENLRSRLFQSMAELIISSTTHRQ